MEITGRSATGSGARRSFSGSEVWDRFSTNLLHELVRLGDMLDGRGWLCMLLISACFLPLAVLEARSNPLSNDEIYTVHIAQAPSLRAMLALAREIDLHPPLHYLAQRVALRLPAPRWLASRVPSILAGWVVCLALFKLGRTRAGNLFGMVAVAIFWFGPVLDSAWVNRPYMMWMAFLCLLLLARDCALERERAWWAIPLVFGLTLAMVMTHLIGIACIGPFLLAELQRRRRRGRFDWPLVGALVLPTLCGLGFYYQIHHLSENAFPVAQAPSLSLAGDMYGAIFGNVVLILGGCALGVAMIFGRKEERFRGLTLTGTEKSTHGFNTEDGVLLLSLLLLPFGLLIPAAVLHLQFWIRYTAAAMPGWALLCVWMLARRMSMARVVAVTVVLASLGYMVQRMVADTTPQNNAGVMEGGRVPVALASLDPNLPIVAASPMTYVEMSDREKPEIARRVFYLTDRAAALQYSHYTLFENEDKISKLLGLPSQVEPLGAFLGEHKTFYVVGDYKRPEIWLLRKLAADGVTMDYKGKFESTYESDDLYLVTQQR